MVGSTRRRRRRAKTTKIRTVDRPTDRIQMNEWKWHTRCGGTELRRSEGKKGHIYIKLDQTIICNLVILWCFVLFCCCLWVAAATAAARFFGFHPFSFLKLAARFEFSFFFGKPIVVRAVSLKSIPCRCVNVSWKVVLSREISTATM